MGPDVVEYISNRANHGIDPHIHIWGWEIPGYLFLGGIVAGIMVLLSLRELLTGAAPESPSARRMPLVAAALLSAGMFMLLLDLEYPLHVLRFYATFEPTSPMSWGSWLLLLVYPALVLQALGALDDRDRTWILGHIGGLRRVGELVFAFADRWRRPVLGASALLGVGLGIYTGLLLGTMVARPMWNTSVLGPLFLVSGISTGAALMLLTRLTHEETVSLTRLDTAAIALELILIAVLIIGWVTGDTVSQRAGAAVLGGAWTAPFWGLVVVVGLLVPFALNLSELRGRAQSTVLTPALVLVGGLALRAVFVGAGQLSTYSFVAAH